MLLKADLLADIKAGKVDTVFRRWKRPTVRAGGTLMTSAGLLSIDSMTPIRLDEVQLGDVQRAGFESLDAFRRWLDTMKQGDLCIIRLHYLGEDPRIAMRNRADLGLEELSEIDAALNRLDARGPWTDEALGLIETFPGRPGDELAGAMGLQKASFRTRVGKLDALGLTERFEAGYRLSPRGQRVLRHRSA